MRKILFAVSALALTTTMPTAASARIFTGPSLIGPGFFSNDLGYYLCEEFGLFCPRKGGERGRGRGRGEVN